MNLATKITLTRIVMIVPAMAMYILAHILTPYRLLFLILAGALFILLSATDFLDGAVARKTNTVSDLGKFLDPLADKVVVVMMMLLLAWQSEILDIAFSYAGLVFVVLCGVVISRELIIGIFRAIASQKGLVLAADVFGKIKTNFLNIGIIILIFAPIALFINWIGQIVFFIGAFFAVFSGINYISKNKQVLVGITVDNSDGMNEISLDIEDSEK
ncbi:MAG: CDP-diacylglycerol--glycerol-3-phosphate 3-phosphatidyltransferase [Clostridia bacterium]|nr:CDP-diacylglycerol--glycerol-3-phosphate 3-phosphatidyltransferase [Clostridia bacterium]